MAKVHHSVLSEFKNNYEQVYGRSGLRIHWGLKHLIDQMQACTDFKGQMWRAHAAGTKAQTSFVSTILQLYILTLS